jgi:NADH-quinone oxidoreductase subunit H
MTEFFDQIFVLLKHWVLTWPVWPDSLKPLVSVLLSIAAIIGVFAFLFGITTVVERKSIGRMQNRYGPNRVGLPFVKFRFCGFGQFIADGIKALTKEDIVPRAADKIVHYLAPIVLVVPVLLAYSVVPVGRNMVPINIDAGVLFFFAVGAATELAVFMAGWSSRNKYSLLGAMRAIAQMISYEVPLIISTITVVMSVGSLSTVKIVEAQTGYSGLLPHWHVLTPWGLAGFFLFLIAAMAESNRSPFDLPEGESEIVAGYFIEYSGFKFALFFLAEYLGMFAISGMAITLFLGGWTAPLSFLAWLPSWLWFFTKLGAVMFFFIWVRGTVPRLRMDQLMNFAWKFMLPLALINIVVAGLWRFLPPGFSRWLFCFALLVVPYVLLARGLASGKPFEKRTYRYAD